MEIKLHENLIVRFDNDKWYYINEKRGRRLEIKNNTILKILNDIGIEGCQMSEVSELIIVSMITELELTNIKPKKLDDIMDNDYFEKLIKSMEVD